MLFIQLNKAVRRENHAMPTSRSNYNDQTKGQFAQEQVELFGHLVGRYGIKADNSKVETITKMSEPTDVVGLKRFLGMVNLMGKYLLNLAETTKPLRELLTA